MDAIYSILLPAPSQNVVPTIRLQLNAGYFLDVPTPMWEPNRLRFPNLSTQYRDLVDAIILDATSREVATIIELHWNDDISQFSPMALKGNGNSTISGDSLTFWSTMAKKYATNPFVFYELFGAPHIDSYETWMEGNTVFEGMRTMTAAVTSQGVKGMILVGGQLDFAYDANSLVQYNLDIASNGKAIYVFQPYMGPSQAADKTKSVQGYVEFVDLVLSSTNRPVMITGVGQFCCPAEGACFQHNGNLDGFAAGYVRAILIESTRRNISWTGFGYRPGNGGDCNQPDANDGTRLYSSLHHNGNGADWATLFPEFFPGDIRFAEDLTIPAAKSDLVGPVVGTVGGVLFGAGAVAFFFYHRRQKRKIENLEADIAKWSESEVRALQEKWQRTHDFEELCSVVPHRSQESVAWKAKSFQQKTKSTFIAGIKKSAHSSFVPSERFAFIYPRKPFNIPRPSFRPPTRENTRDQSLTSSNAGIRSGGQPSPFASFTSRRTSNTHGSYLAAHPSYLKANNPTFNSTRTNVSNVSY